MLLMPSEGLTIYHLVMTGAGSPWNGQGYVLIISVYRVTLFSLFLSSLLHSNWNFAVAIFFFFEMVEISTLLTHILLLHGKSFFFLNKIRGNVVGIAMGPSQWQIRGRRKLCLLSTLIQFERGNGILKGILNLMEMSFMSGFGAILHSCSLKHKKKQPRPLSLQIEGCNMAIT